MPDITLVIVNYFSSSLAGRAIASAREKSSASLRVVVVDNSVDPGEASAVESIDADEVIVAPDNLGYSGGANLGVAAASTSVVVVSNPDVVFGDRCLDLLAGQLSGDVAVAGPVSHWDEEGRWLLPPADFLNAREKLSQVIASRFEDAAKRRNLRRTRRRVDFWRGREAGPVDAVSGAVMAIDRRKFSAVGGFDERFELYFEEIDLARRFAARGWHSVHVPAARCRHLYNQSAALDSSAHEKFMRSEVTYLRRWAPLALLIGRAMKTETRTDESRFAAASSSDLILLPSSDREWLVEAAPFPSFDSGVGCFVQGEGFRFPPEVWTSCGMPNVFLRVMDPNTLEVAGEHVIRR